MNAHPSVKRTAFRAGALSPWAVLSLAAGTALAGESFHRFMTACRAKDFVPIPFKELHFALNPERTRLVRESICPVPDPAFPFSRFLVEDMAV